MKNGVVKYHSRCTTLVHVPDKPLNVTFDNRGIFCSLLCLFSLLLGLAPIFLNVIIDPYNLHGLIDLGIKKEKLSLKAHYPLWKIANYDQNADTLILGDSRALALKNKYWHQLNFNSAYNFAYGGATIAEIYDTFEYIKESPALKNLIIGIQLRSFSQRFKKGMNRVPEAINLKRHPSLYYSNNFVTKMSWLHLQKHYKKQLQRFTNIQLISRAQAQSEKSLSTLLSPTYCTSCELPHLTQSAPLPQPYSAMTPYPQPDFGIWGYLWPAITLQQNLPKRFARQVSKNAKSDWKNFEFSTIYWQQLQAIASWCKEHNIKLYFFIPPTIVEMQQQIHHYGHAQINHQLRQRLAQLSPVVDFDFVNDQTSNLSLFQDAYHFNSQFAKAIIGEFALLLAPSKEVTKNAYKRRSLITCPIFKNDIKSVTNDQQLQVTQGSACRIWRRYNEH